VSRFPLVTIGTDDDRFPDGDVAADPAAQADDTAFNLRSCFDDAAIAHETLLKPGGANARCRQEAHAREHETTRAVKVKSGRILCQAQARLVIRLDGAQVLPVAIE